MQGDRNSGPVDYVAALRSLVGEVPATANWPGRGSTLEPVDPNCTDVTTIVRANAHNLQHIARSLHQVLLGQNTLAFGAMAILEKSCLMEAFVTEAARAKTNATHSQMRARMGIRAGIPVPNFPFNCREDAEAVLGVRRHVEKIAFHCICQVDVEDRCYVRSLHNILVTEQFKSTVKWNRPASL